MRTLLALLAGAVCITMGGSCLGGEGTAVDSSSAADLAYHQGKAVLARGGTASISERSPRQLEEAIACFERALSFDPEHAPSLNSLGYSHYWLAVLAHATDPPKVDPATWPHHVSAALSSWKLYVRLRPPTGRLYYLMGELHHTRGDLAYTAHYWKLASEMGSAQPYPAQLVALYETELKDLGAAEAVLREQLRRARASAQMGIPRDAERQLAGFLMRHGRMDEGIALFSRRAERTPTAWSFFELGNALEYAGRPAEALIWYSRAQDRNPPFAKSLEEAIARARAQLPPEPAGNNAPAP